MNALLKNALLLAGLAIATQATAQVTFFEHDDYQGRSFTTTQQNDNFDRDGFNDLASSVIVDRDRWEVCENAQYGGRCVVLQPGRYPSLNAMGLNDRVSSVRLAEGYERAAESRYGPPPPPPGAYYRRQNEALYEAEVTSVHAVVGAPEQRCWVEREQVATERDRANVPGAIVGAVLGGILGHQVGGGRGQDVATAGGAVAGAAIGANVGRDGGQRGYTQDVQHCADRPSQARPEYWDVTYYFQGQQHRVQMSAPPGPTIRVNAQGDPRE